MRSPRPVHEERSRAVRALGVSRIEPLTGDNVSTRDPLWRKPFLPLISISGRRDSVLLLRRRDVLLLASFRLELEQAIDQLTELLSGNVVEGCQPEVLLSPHLQKYFVHPAKIRDGRYLPPQEPGASAELRMGRQDEAWP
jgi:hypothetical protein